MKTSKHFERMLYHDSSISEYVEVRQRSPFVTDPLQSHLDTCAVDSLVGKLEHGPEINNRIAPALESFADAWTERLDRPDQVQRFVKDRIFLIRQKNSYSRLSITRSLFESLVLECNIFPQFIEFVLCFGAKHFESEIGPPHLLFRPLVVGGAGSFSDGYECAYVLRLVELNRRGDEGRPWSMRQFAVHQRYVTSSNTSTWTYIALTKRCEVRLKGYLGGVDGGGISNPFEIHLLLLDMAVANWRPYLVWLTAEINERADKVIVSSVEGDSLVPMADFNERQRLKQLEDDIVDMQLMLDSTLDSVEAMLVSYTEKFMKTRIQGQSQSDLLSQDLIIGTLHEKRGEVNLLRTKVTALRTKLAGTTELQRTQSEDFGRGI
ncbi:hypothetical protein LTR10_018828 [Elasticomyces elasticus]|uniref:CorA-like transporter domain-containing protein n=1 Tax=Exophiala sideris TaxID=1016849 RepID=A0ABR0IWN0_9EURO|nr:hypothetical protein LTR10_018828 [Elasticomyces elasticus]KAK5021627.1 hypothetical protein LTS07_010798 [Exophiala sideris]KAK5024869.1 hypothetical protein LTR13_010712 [Exophiala sideris]KAK5049765.1 hypothetical protein LTR69_010822 [Exophiala sideris]KAK5176745.1 hypothetical protein LTR44_010688 [Eurotiomycetes sp. CCFEE 6388]